MDQQIKPLRVDNLIIILVLEPIYLQANLKVKEQYSIYGENGSIKTGGLCRIIRKLISCWRANVPFDKIYL